MKEKLTNNWWLKLISVILAVILWLIVCNQVNPVVTRTVTVRQVEYLNEDVVIEHDMTYSVDSLANGIEVTVPVSKMDSNKVRATDFTIQVDLSKIGPFGTAEVNVVWNNPGTYTLQGDLSWKTTTVDVTLEDIISKTYTVNLTLEGEPAEGYIVSDDTSVSPRTVKITAPQSVMAQIHSVGIEVNVSDQVSELEGEAALQLYDVSGSRLELHTDQYEDYEFSLSAETIGYEIPVLKTKEVKLQFEGTTGKVADGYRYTGIDGSNQTVHIAGLRAVLAEVDSIFVPADLLNLEGATQNVPVQIDLSSLVPEGVTLESESLVTVTLVVEPLVTQTRELLPEEIRIEDADENLTYTIENNVIVTVEGLEEDLNALTDEMLDAWISVEGLELRQSEEGGAADDYQVEVHVSLDNGFSLVDVETAEVRVSERSSGQSSRGETQSAEEERNENTGGTGETVGTSDDEPQE